MVLFKGNFSSHCYQACSEADMWLWGFNLQYKSTFRRLIHYINTAELGDPPWHHIMVPKEGKGAKPVTKIVNYLVKKCGFRYFKSFCSLCKRLVFIFLASSIWFETSLNCTFPWAPIKWTPSLNIKFNTQIIMKKLTFEPMKIEGQHKKIPT